MSVAITVLLASSLVCQQPAVPFKEFYAQFYFPGAGSSWQASPYEDRGSVVLRITEAMAGYSDYLAARLEKCAGAKR